MQPNQMDKLIDAHISAEMAGDTAAAVSMYTDEVEHDVVGWPSGPVRGPEAAKGFYDQLVVDFDNEQMLPTRKLYGTDFCVVEHETTGTVPGTFLGIPGHGRRITFRMLHVWEFQEGRISRENVWLDGGAIAAQLTTDAAEITA